MDYYLLDDRPAARRRAARISHDAPGEGLNGLSRSLVPGRRRRASGLPLYLHLLRRHTTTPQPVQLADVLRAAHAKLDQAPPPALSRCCLSLARSLLLLLLALAFANPFINRSAAQHDQREAGAAGDRQFLQHARRHAPGRRQARGARRARFAQARRARAGDGARLAAAGADAAHSGSGALRAAVDSISPAIRAAASASSRARVRSMAETVHTPIELHLFSDMQKTDMPASFSELALPANVTLVLHPVAKAAVPNWTVESVNAPGQVWDPKKARVQAVIAGYDTPAATRTVSLVVNGKTVATQAVDVPAERTRHRRIPVARRALRLQPLRGADRFRRRACPPTMPASSPSSAPTRSRCCSFTNRTIRARRSISAPRWPRPRNRRSRCDVVTVERGRQSRALEIRFRRSVRRAFAAAASSKATWRRYVRGGGSVLIAAGTSAASPRRIPVFGDNILDAHYYSRDGAALPDRGRHRSLPSVHRQGRALGGREVLLSRCASIPAMRASSPGSPTRRRCCSKENRRRPRAAAHFRPRQSHQRFPAASRLRSLRRADRALSFRHRAPQRLARWWIPSSNCAPPRNRPSASRSIDPDGQRPLSLNEATSAQSFQLTRPAFTSCAWPTAARI